jgi:hydroxymethylpyrimidine/phosphomethylpyrimidine kinase
MSGRGAPCVLVLAGLDPSGGAGLLADAEAVRAQGARPLCVATALTAQTDLRVLSFQPVAPSFALASARALLAAEDVRAIKVGMLGTPQMARAVADLLSEAGLPAVVDPVVAASSGDPLFRGSPEEARSAYAALWPGAVVTPNAPEARLLLGREDPISSPAEQEEAGRAFVARGARAALVKGGHAQGAEAVDVLVSAAGALHLTGPRLAGSARGTGCRLASALAAGLARGLSLEDAARAAKEFVAAYLRFALAP